MWVLSHSLTFNFNACNQFIVSLRLSDLPKAEAAYDMTNTLDAEDTLDAEETLELDTARLQDQCTGREAT